jgi:hypothetical protein
MASLNEYTFDVKSLLRNYHIIDEDTLSERQVEFWIIQQRSLWARRRDRAYISSDLSLQQVLIEDIISIDRSFLPTNVPATYRILRSNRVLPKLMNFESWDGIITTGPADMVSKRWNHCMYNEAVNSGYGRFNKSQIFSFMMNGYLYIISRSNSNYWKYISQTAVVGIFEDPRELGNFKHVIGEACWSADDDYPISLELWAYMKDEIKKGNINELVKIPVDKGNDDNFQKTDIS